MSSPSATTRVSALALVMMGVACSPSTAELDGPTQLDLAVIPVSPKSVNFRSRVGDVVASMEVEHVDLDRVDARWHRSSDRIAAVVHHGRHGGASLVVLRRTTLEQRILMTTDPSEDLSAPSWSADGTMIAVVKRLAPASSKRLAGGGQLWLVDPDSATATRLAGIVDAERAVGWDDHRLLFTRRGPGDDLAGERLYRIDASDLRQEALVGGGNDDRPTSFHYSFQLVGDRIAYLSSDGPIISLPSPEQEVDLVLADLEGTPQHVLPHRGEMPTSIERRGSELSYQIEGSLAERTLDLRSGLVIERTRIRSLPPSTTSTSVASLPMPYVHQVYDTPNTFNGHWACGPTSTLMAIQHFGRLPKWPITVDTPSAHNSDYGAYVARKYSAFGSSFDRVQNDASGKPAKGAYGWCTDGGGAWAWRMQDYAKRHNLKSDFSGSPTFAKVEAALSAGKVVVLSTKLTSAGHIITVRGTNKSGKLITNDPYGDRNLPSYPNTKGEGASYTWAQVASKWYITVHGTPSKPPKPEYQAKRIDLSFPSTMSSGSEAEASVTFQNEGTATWDENTHLGTTKPKDRESPFHTPGSWLGKNRAAAASSAKPGEKASFAFTLTAPPDICEPTTFEEHFNLVQEGVAWFSDSEQGGPADDALVLKITVVPADLDNDGVNSCTDCDDADAQVHPEAEERCNDKDDDCDGQVDEGLDCTGNGNAEHRPNNGSEDGTRLPLEGGCSLAAGPGFGLDPLPVLGLWLLLVARSVRRRPWRRSRRRCSPAIPSSRPWTAP